MEVSTNTVQMLTGKQCYAVTQNEYSITYCIASEKNEVGEFENKSLSDFVSYCKKVIFQKFGITIVSGLTELGWVCYEPKENINFGKFDKTEFDAVVGYANDLAKIHSSAKEDEDQVQTNVAFEEALDLFDRYSSFKEKNGRQIYSDCTQSKSV